MSYIRGKTYIWEGSDGFHIWGKNDPLMESSIWFENKYNRKSGGGIYFKKRMGDYSQKYFRKTGQQGINNYELRS